MPVLSKPIALRWAKTSGKVVALLIAFVLAMFVLLRFQYAWLPGSARTVELNEGRFLLELPKRWDLSDHGGNEYQFSDRTLPQMLVVRLEHRPLPAAPEERTKLLTVAGGEPPFRELEPNRFYRTLPATGGYQSARGETLPLTRHEVFVFDARRGSWHLTADLWQDPRVAGMPNPSADAAFFAKTLPAVRVESKPHSAERDEWSAGSVELGKANRDFESSVDIVLFSFVGFLLAWAVAHTLFEKVLRLDKARYTYVSQFTTLISVVGILLVGVAFFVSRSENRMQMAQIAADAAFDKALTYYQQSGQLCRSITRNGSWNLAITPSPESPTEMGALIDCTKLTPYCDAMSAYLLDAREHLVKGGDFVDPMYRLGFPISLFIGRAHELASRIPDLQVDQQYALSERFSYYFDPIESVLRLIQTQQNMIDLSAGLGGSSKYWSVMLAIAAALTMVKHASDRRFEREKEKAREARGGEGAPPRAAPAPPPRDHAPPRPPRLPPGRRAGPGPGRDPDLDPGPATRETATRHQIRNARRRSDSAAHPSRPRCRNEGRQTDYKLTRR